MMKKKVPTEQAFNKVIQALGKGSFHEYKVKCSMPWIARFGGKKKKRGKLWEHKFLNKSGKNATGRG